MTAQRAIILWVFWNVLLGLGIGVSVAFIFMNYVFR